MSSLVVCNLSVVICDSSAALVMTVTKGLQSFVVKDGDFQVEHNDDF